MTITEFLTARLDEEEQNARLALERHVGPDGTPYWPRPSARAAARMNADPGQLAGARIIDTYSPARVLREVAAKRKIVAELEEFWDEAHLSTEEYAAGHAKALLWVGLQLAAVHADHPDYQQAWAP